MIHLKKMLGIIFIYFVKNGHIYLLSEDKSLYLDISNKTRDLNWFFDIS